MELEEKFFGESKKKIEEYVQDRLLLIRLQTVEKISRIASKFFSVLIIGLLSFFILLFISIMAGYLFADLTGSFYIGFGIVAAFYIIALAVILVMRKNLIEKRVTDTIIETIFDKAEQ